MKHLFEEDHNLSIESNLADDSLEAIADRMDVAYGLDPLELLIHLEELQTLISKSLHQDKLVAFKRAPRPTKSNI